MKEPGQGRGLCQARGRPSTSSSTASLAATSPSDARQRRGQYVIVELENVAKAVAAHDSADYQAALKVFDNAAERDFRIVEGLE